MSRIVVILSVIGGGRREFRFVSVWKGELDREFDNCSRSEMGRAKGMNLFENLYWDRCNRSFLFNHYGEKNIFCYSVFFFLVIYFIDKFKVSPINHFYYIERNMLERKEKIFCRLFL